MAAGLAGQEKGRLQPEPADAKEPKEIVEQMALLSKNLSLLDGRIETLAVRLFDVSSIKEEVEKDECQPTPSAPLALKLLEHNINLFGMVERIELITARLEI